MTEHLHHITHTHDAGYGIHDGSVSFAEANDDTLNPYE